MNKIHYYKRTDLRSGEVVCRSFPFMTSHIDNASKLKGFVREWNDRYVDRFHFEFVPKSCVKRLFGCEFKEDMRIWPQ